MAGEKPEQIEPLEVPSLHSKSPRKTMQDTSPKAVQVPHELPKEPSTNIAVQRKKPRKTELEKLQSSVDDGLRSRIHYKKLGINVTVKE